MSGNVIMPMTVQDLESLHLSYTISIEAMKKECTKWNNAVPAWNDHARDAMYSHLYKAEEMQTRISKALHRVTRDHVA